MAEIFSTRARIRFHQADPAGVLFFAKVFALAHDAYEDFIASLGFEWSEWFAHPDWAVPIRQSSCEFFLPLRPGRTYDISVFVDRIGKSSFTLRYDFEDDGETLCRVSLVHTFIRKKVRGKISIPSKIRERLESYQSKSLESE